MHRMHKPTPEVVLLQSMFGQVIAQRALADAHRFGGVFLHPARILERAPQGFALGPIEILFEIR